MNDAIETLYSTFAHYRIDDDFAGCDCCVNPEDSAALAKRPLRELTYDDLERYSRKAISTWGTGQHFKHFLPRLFELTIDHRDDFLDLAVVFGKLAHAQWQAWPKQEQNAVNRFFADYWRHQLANPIAGAFDEAIDTVLCALSNACLSVQPYLRTWLLTDSDNAKRHLAAFILSNDSNLLEKGQLWNPFWDSDSQAHGEVVNWLQSQAVMDYLGSCEDSVLNDDFSYALPQVMAIRSSLADT